MALSYQKRFSRRLIEDVRPPGKFLLLGKFVRSPLTGQCFFFPTPSPTNNPLPPTIRKKVRWELVVLIFCFFLHAASTEITD